MKTFDYFSRFLLRKIFKYFSENIFNVEFCAINDKS